MARVTNACSSLVNSKARTRERAEVIIVPFSVPLNDEIGCAVLCGLLESAYR